MAPDAVASKEVIGERFTDLAPAQEGENGPAFQPPPKMKLSTKALGNARVVDPSSGPPAQPGNSDEQTLKKIEQTGMALMKSGRELLRTAQMVITPQKKECSEALLESCA